MFTSGLPEIPERCLEGFTAALQEPLGASIRFETVGCSASPALETSLETSPFEPQT